MVAAVGLRNVRIVLALGWYFPESLGGTEVYVDALAQQFTAAGYDVRIAAPLAGLDSPREYEWRGQRVFRYPVPDAPSRAEARGDTAARGAEALTNWLRKAQPDVVHLHSLVTGLGLHEIEAARAVGARVVLTNHLPSLGFLCLRGTMLRWGREACDGTDVDRPCAACLLQQRGVPAPLARVAVAVEPLWFSRVALDWPGSLGTGLAVRALVEQSAWRQRRLLDLVDRVVVLSDWAASILEANGAPSKRIVVNKLGISRPGVAPKPSVDRRPTRLPVVIGYVGRYDWVKGLREFAQAITQVRSDALRFQFRGPVDNSLAKDVRAHLERAIGADPRVTFHDPVTPDQIPQVLAELDVLCCPSTWFENGPTIALEAHAVGTPVIGTRLGAFLETVRDGVNGRLVPPADPQALADVFAEVAARPSVVDEWRRGIGQVRTMHDCAADYLRLYPTLVHEAVVGL